MAADGGSVMSEDFDGIMAGLEDAIAFVRCDATRGRVVRGQPAPAKAGVKAIRAKTKLSQIESQTGRRPN